MKISSKALAIVFAISAGSFAPVAALAQSTNSQPSAPATSTQASNTIVGVAATNPDFSTLVQAVQAAGLVQTLSGPGPFTVFAPTNEAFAALPPGVLQALLEPQNRDLLTQILTYHVVSGELPSSQIRTGSVDSLNGPLNIQAASSGVTVNNATVTTPDVEASNGVIHVIDEVLVPQTVATELSNRLQNAGTPGTTRTQSAGTTGMTGTTGTTSTTGTTTGVTGTTGTTGTTRTQTSGTTGTTSTTGTTGVTGTTRTQTTGTAGTTGTTGTTGTVRTQTSQTTETTRTQTTGTTGTVRTQTTGTTGTTSTTTQTPAPVRGLW